MTKDRISIIIPVYNASKFLQKNFESVISQTHKLFEAIYVDDGSSDESLKLLKSFAEADERIRVISQENGGVSSARNAGLAIATGEYVCFVDSDDYILPDYLEVLHGLMKKHDADITACDFFTNAQQPCENTIEVYDKKEILLKKLLFNKKKISIITILVKRGIIETNSLAFDKRYKYGEDLHFLWKSILFSNKLVITNKQLYHYTINENSAMSRFSNDRLHSAYAFKDLEPIVQAKAPEISKIYNKYAVAKAYWSLFWISAIMLDNDNYIEFLQECSYRKIAKQLLSYRNMITSLSSALLLVSKKLFRKFAILVKKSAR